jgi:hypothetical protein
MREENEIVYYDRFDRWSAGAVSMPAKEVKY